MNKLLQFINEDRSRYTTQDNNRFAFSFYKATRYWNFLSIISQRYEVVSNQWHENIEAFTNYHQSSTQESLEQEIISLPGGGKMNFKVMKLFQDAETIETTIQLDIEAFYLFSKTLLDKLANGIWKYFGSVHKKGCTLTSHDDLTRHFEEYAAIKNVNIPNGFMDQAIKLRELISDFRDWQISHERNPERNTFSSHMTIWDEKEQYLKLRIIRFHSETNREETSSLRLDILLHEIDVYADMVADVLDNNKKLSIYTTIM